MEDMTTTTPMVGFKKIIFEDPKKEATPEKKVEEAATPDSDADSAVEDLEQLDCTANGVLNTSMTCCSALKNLLIMIMLMYFWCWTSDNRDTAIDVLNQMCRNNELNITFHSNAISQVNTWNSKKTLRQVEVNKHIKTRMATYENGAMGNMPTLVWQDTDECKDHHYHQNGTLNNSCVQLSEDLGSALRILMNAEFGDKTFLLITIFTMAWSTWHLKEHIGDVHHDHHEEEEEVVQKEGGDDDADAVNEQPAFQHQSTQLTETKKLYKGEFRQEHGVIIHEADGKHKAHTHTSQKIKANVLQLFITSSLGTILVNWKSLEFQKEIRVNEVGLFVSLSCVLILMFFLFGICNQHMQASNDNAELRKKQEDQKRALVKDHVIEQFNKLEEQKRTSKKFQRDAYHMYKIEDSLIKEEHRIEAIAVEKEFAKQMAKHKNEMKRKAKEHNAVCTDPDQQIHASLIEASAIETSMVQKELEIKTDELGLRKQKSKTEKEQLLMPGTMEDQFSSVLNWDAHKRIEQRRILKEKEDRETKERHEKRKKLRKERDEREAAKHAEKEAQKLQATEKSMAFEETSFEAPQPEKSYKKGLTRGLTMTKSELYQQSSFGSQLSSEDSDQKSNINEEEDNKKELPHAKIIRHVITFIKNFFYQLLFMAFIATQEVDDTSFLTQIQLRANYTIFTLQCANALCHLIMNFLIIGIVYVYVGLCVSLKESNLISMLTIYFICGYEFVNHVMFWTAQLLGKSYFN